MNVTEEIDDEPPKTITIDDGPDVNEKCAHSTLKDSNILSAQSSTSDLGSTTPSNDKATPTSSICDILVTDNVDSTKTSAHDTEDNDGIISKINSLIDDDACSDLIDEDLKLHWDEEEETENPDKIQGVETGHPSSTTDTNSKSIPSPKTSDDPSNMTQITAKVKTPATDEKTFPKSLISNENTSEKVDEDFNKHVEDTTADSLVVNTSLKQPVQHGLMKPDQMIEIPTQELIDIDDSCLLDDTNKTAPNDIDDNIVEFDNLEDINSEENNTQDEEKKLIAIAKSCDTILLEDTITIDSSDHEDNDVDSCEDKCAEVIDNTIENVELKIKSCTTDSILDDDINNKTDFKINDLMGVPEKRPVISVPDTGCSDINIQSVKEGTIIENSKGLENITEASEIDAVNNITDSKNDKENEITDQLDTKKEATKYVPVPDTGSSDMNIQTLKDVTTEGNSKDLENITKEINVDAINKTRKKVNKKENEIIDQLDTKKEATECVPVQDAGSSDINIQTVNKVPEENSKDLENIAEEIMIDAINNITDEENEITDQLKTLKDITESVSVPDTGSSDINVQCVKEGTAKVNSIDLDNITEETKIDTINHITDKENEIKDQLDSKTESVDGIQAKTIMDEREGVAKDEIIESESTNKSDESTKCASNNKVPYVTSALDPKPSTSKAVFEVLGAEDVEVTEVDDSLGLLAESSRVMEDDDDEDEAEADAEVDDDDDGDAEFDPDDDSNQVSGDQSEDSNAPQSETEQPKEAGIEVIATEDEKETPSPTDADKEFEFASATVDGEDKDDIDIDMIECEEMEVPSPTVEDSEKVVEEELKEPSDPLDKAPEDKMEVSEQDAVIVAVSSSEEVVKVSDDSSKNTDTDVPKKEPPNTLLASLLSDPLKTPMRGPQANAASNSVYNIVDLEESSSEDDVQEVNKDSSIEKTDVNIPKGIEVTASSGGSMSEIVTKEDEVVISGVPKPTPKKHNNTTRLNTSELTIKTCPSDSTLVIPETTIVKEENGHSKPKMGLEVFSLDSDDDETTISATSALSPQKGRTYKCVNPTCTNDAKLRANRSILAYYTVKSKKRHVCESCAAAPLREQEKLVKGLLNLTPLLDLDMDAPAQQLVEISDSDEEDVDDEKEHNQLVGEKGADFLETHLSDMINLTWKKLKMDMRLDEVQKAIVSQMDSLEEESKEIDTMLSECQVATDKLRNELYLTFEHKRHELPAIVIFDTMPDDTITCLADEEDRVLGKRRMPAFENPPPKRPAIQSYGPVETENSKITDKTKETDEHKMDDDNTDVSVVKLCAEIAPTSLPAVGEIIRPALKIGQHVFAMRNAFGAWTKARVMDVQPPKEQQNQKFSVCRVKFEHKQTKSPFKVLPARSLAYIDPPEVRLTIGTRVIALFKNEEDLRRESYYSGVVAEIPNPVNKYRYLVFFDDGYAQYVPHQSTRVVVESSVSVWEEVHPFSREFVRKYLLSYPERPMVRLHAGQSIKTEWNGKWWVSRVIQVDASLVQVHFEGDDRTEWIYRGSTRLAPLYMELQAAKGPLRRTVPRSKAAALSNMPYVEYTRSDEQNTKSAETQKAQQKQEEEIRRQRAVAKKSTATAPATATAAPAPAPLQTQPQPADGITSRVVYYTPKNAVKPFKMSPHNCGPRCKRSDVLSLKDLRTYNPLAKPLLSGWERQLVRSRGHKAVMYRAPCGRRLRNLRELHTYLTLTGSALSVDLFDFCPTTHCLAEFMLNSCLVGKKDLSHGRENVPVPCVNYYDNSLPEFCSYNTERTPTAGVPLNLDPEFLCGCDCTDDCQDKSKCACWKMTLEGARTIGMGSEVGYVYRRLPEPLPSGIYECNSRCKCKNTCLNRVVQHPLQLKLQVFKTLNRGWGIRALNDVPKGAFLCIYAGNLLTDATANLDGLNEGDEYLAELDYIEVVEQMKEGYEEDIPDDDKELDKRGSKQTSEDDEEDELSSSEDEGPESKTEQDDDDFKLAPFVETLISNTVQPRKSSRRSKRKQEKVRAAEVKREEEKQIKKEKSEDDCITISDDEEVREPSRFMAEVGMDAAKELKPKYNSVREYFGKDEACYIMDAKVQGNIGRYLNHSCSPNVFVQNVFVDTHDPRFPWVAFFALTPIKAGSELTWNYNYDVGSVPDKVLYCYCGTPNCRGRLL